MIITGHRGARGLAPENTKAGLLKALEHQVDEVEIDTQVTKDEVVILLHNPSLRDAAGNKLKAADHTYRELKNHKSDLITLSDAIDILASKVPLVIDVKFGVPTQPIIKVLRKYLDAGWMPDRFVLGSLSQKKLREFHRALPEVEIIVFEAISGIVARRRARQVQTKRIGLWHGTLYSWYIKMTARSGYKLTAWTVNNPRKIARWKRAGLYGVITDYPDRFEK